MESSEILLKLLLTGVASGLFLALYHVLLRKETHFGLLRAFILGAFLFCLVFPFIPLPFPPAATVVRVEIEQMFSFPLHEVTGEEPPVRQIEDRRQSSWPALMLCLYLLGVCLYGIRYVKGLLHIRKLIRGGQKVRNGSRNFILSDAVSTPFTFGRYLLFPCCNFGKVAEAVIRHEEGHLHYRHTLDLLLLEFFITLQWFNPVAYLFKARLLEIHEYQADAFALSGAVDPLAYQQLLLHAAIPGHDDFFVSHFYNSLTKRRIDMIDNTRLPKLKWYQLAGIFSLATLLLIGNAFVMAPIPPTAATETFHAPPPSTTSGATANPEFRLPLPGGSSITMTSGFGMRVHPMFKEKQFHRGVDFKAAMGTSIFASADGQVIKAGSQGPYGKRIHLQHKNGFISTYSHLSEIEVRVGQQITGGSVIGKVGSTGLSMAPHLHFEISKDGEFVDPMMYLPM